jgi:hypothetical protein
LAGLCSRGENLQNSSGVEFRRGVNAVGFKTIATGGSEKIFEKTVKVFLFHADVAVCIT